MALSAPKAARATLFVRIVANSATTTSTHIHATVNHWTRLIAVNCEGPIVAMPICLDSAMVLISHRPVHHLEHLRASSSHKADDEHCGEDEENDVEIRRVIPLNRGLNNLGMTL